MSETNESMERLERFLVQLREVGEAYAEAAADYELQEHLRKVVLAEQMAEAVHDGIVAVAAQEREARSSDEYLAHLEKLRDARRTMERLKARMDAMKLAASLRQSQLATERAEIRAYS